MSDLEVVQKDVESVAKLVDAISTRQQKTDDEVKQIIGTLGDISATQKAMLKELHEIKSESKSEAEDIHRQIRGIYSRRDEDMQRAKPNYVLLGVSLVTLCGAGLTFLMYFANLMIAPLQLSNLEQSRMFNEHLDEFVDYKSATAKRLEQGNEHMGSVNAQLSNLSKMQDWLFQEVVSMKSNRHTKEDEAASMDLLFKLLETKSNRTDDGQSP